MLYIIEKHVNSSQGTCLIAMKSSHCLTYILKIDLHYKGRVVFYVIKKYNVSRLRYRIVCIISVMQ